LVVELSLVRNLGGAPGFTRLPATGGSRPQSHHDLGADHFDRRSTEIKARRLAAQIKKQTRAIGRELLRTLMTLLMDVVCRNVRYLDRRRV
jgi:hypothetical protein